MSDGESITRFELRESTMNTRMVIRNRFRGEVAS